MKKLDFVKEIISRVEHCGYERPFVSNGNIIVCGSKKTAGKEIMDAFLTAFDCMGLKDCFAQSEQYKRLGVFAVYIDFDAIAAADDALEP